MLHKVVLLIFAAAAEILLLKWGHSSESFQASISLFYQVKESFQTPF